MITELACGELNSRDETRVRAHAERCEACSTALLGFQQMIWAASEAELEEPSEGLDARVMAAAEAALQKRRSSAKGNAGASAVRPPASGLGRWLTSPQFAIAAVVLVVAGMGLRAMRAGESEHAALAPAQSTTAATTPAPTATGAVVPVPAAEPRAAAPRRASPRGESAEEKRVYAPGRSETQLGAVAPATAEPARRERVAEKSSVENSTRTADDTLAQAPAARKRSAAATTSSVEAPGTASPSAEGSGGTAALEAVAADQAPARALAPAAVAPEAAASPKTAEPAGGAGTANAPALSTSPAPAAPAATASPAPAAPAATASPAPAAPAATATTAAAPPRPISERADLSRGILALSAGKIQQAIVILFPLARNGSDEVRDLAQTLLAEALHDAGRCQDAIPWFNRVVARPSASRKSLELAADCFAKTGKDAKAEELRKRAQGR
jgi:hypothetical protein